MHTDREKRNKAMTDVLEHKKNKQTKKILLLFFIIIMKCLVCFTVLSIAQLPSKPHWK